MTNLEIIPFVFAPVTNQALDICSYVVLSGIAVVALYNLSTLYAPGTALTGPVLQDFFFQMKYYANKMWDVMTSIYPNVEEYSPILLYNIRDVMLQHQSTFNSVYRNVWDFSWILYNTGNIHWDMFQDVTYYCQMASSDIEEVIRHIDQTLAMTGII